MLPRSPRRRLQIAVWLLALDGLLLVPISWKARELRAGWRAWRSAVAVEAQGVQR